MGALSTADLGLHSGFLMPGGLLIPALSGIVFFGGAFSTPIAMAMGLKINLRCTMALVLAIVATIVILLYSLYKAGGYHKVFTRFLPERKITKGKISFIVPSLRQKINRVSTRYSETVSEGSRL